MNLISEPIFWNFDLFPNLYTEFDQYLEYDQNEKKTFIAYADKDKEQLTFLAKILSSVQYDLKRDVVLAAVKSSENLHFSHIQRRFEFQKALFFGVLPAQLGFQARFQLYQTFELNGVFFLFADSLAQIQSDLHRKRSLWQEMQVFFKP